MHGTKHDTPPATTRCVVLRHELPDDSWHHDLLLERPPATPQAAADPDDRRLIAFRTAPPPHDPTITSARATRLPDHRALYLDYEGPLTADRGAVRRLAEARLLHLTESDASLTAMLAFPDATAELDARRQHDDQWRLLLRWSRAT